MGLQVKKNPTSISEKRETYRRLRLKKEELVSYSRKKEGERSRGIAYNLQSYIMDNELEDHNRI